MKEIVIVDYVRTAFTKAQDGALANVYPNDMEAALVSRLLERTGIEPKDVEAIYTGNAFPEGPTGLNDARNVVLHPDSGLPNSVSATTVNKFCGSSMDTIHKAAGAIALGSGDVFIITGVETMSQNPKMIGARPMLNPKIYEGNVEGFLNMGRTAENLARSYKISRSEQEDFAIRSQQKAAKAQAEGKFDDEIVPIQRDDGVVVDKDDLIRGSVTKQSISKLRPAFEANGTITAATSSPFTDGASAVMVTSMDYAKENGLKPLAKVLATAESGCAPEIMGIGPVEAVEKALKRANLTIDDIDVWELNEAFAAQSLAVLKELGVDESKVNIDGGAIALGHPLGASGARITGKAAQILQREDKRYAVSTMCIGGGQGIATVLERFKP
jgi:acetyl-CoA acyltransferase